MADENKHLAAEHPLYRKRIAIVGAGPAGLLGVGANMAMLDAVELADHLVSDQFASLSDAIASFESSMHARMAPLVQGALSTQELLFADDAPAALVKSFRDGASEDQGEPAQPAS